MLLMDRIKIRQEAIKNGENEYYADLSVIDSEYIKQRVFQENRIQNLSEYLESILDGSRKAK
jgi:hypothetical protein